MSQEIELALEKAVTLTEVEDIYRPYKQKRKTRASVAIAKGLKPLAESILVIYYNNNNILHYSRSFKVINPKDATR